MLYMLQSSVTTATTYVVSTAFIIHWDGPHPPTSPAAGRDAAFFAAGDDVITF